MNKLKLLLFVIILLIISYVVSCIVVAGKLIKEKNISVNFDGIRMEVQPSYPDTDNPYMEGVTVQEYTAIVVKDK